ncbi:MAG: hypothetical protein FWD43_00930 [Coriobacteriia bacterium]|nr:hypothetical protein [Coriobacteriia bacterium]
MISTKPAATYATKPINKSNNKPINKTDAIDEAILLIQPNMTRLTDEMQQQRSEHQLDTLALEIHLASGIPCFIVAPRNSGRTSLVHRYSQQFRQGDDVHWLDGSSESFIQGVEAGTLARFLLKCTIPGVAEHVLIVDDLAYLEPWQAEQFSDDVDRLIEFGWRVIVVTVPQYDCYHNLQSDRFLISGSDLLNPAYCSPAQQSSCILSFLTDALPLEMRLFASLTAVLSHLSVKEALDLGFTMHDDLPLTLAAFNPLFTLDKSDSKLLRLAGMPLQPLLPGVIQVLFEYYAHTETDQRLTCVVETLTLLSMELLKRGQLSRSHEVLICIEALLAEDYQVQRSQAQETLSQGTQATGMHEHKTRVQRMQAQATLTQNTQIQAVYDQIPDELHIGQMIIQELEATEVAVRQLHQHREPLYIRLFGDVEVYRGNVRVEHHYLRGKRVQSLLALILLSPRKCITRDTAVQQFWPRMDIDRAINNFHVTTSRLSRSLSTHSDEDDRYLLRSGTHYHLDTSLVTSDIDQFEELARRAIMRNLSMPEQLEVVRQMESLYRDELLAGTRLDGVLQQYRKRQRDFLVDALLSTVAMAHTVGDAQATLWFTRRAYDYDHTREDVYRALMDAQFSAGQRTSAIETYFACKSYLNEELGILPSAKTTALYQNLILNRA